MSDYSKQLKHVFKCTFKYLNYVSFPLYFLNSLWFDCIFLSLLQEIIDVVVVDFYVGDEDAVAAVLIRTICFISLLWLYHISNFRIKLLSEIKVVTYYISVIL